MQKPVSSLSKYLPPGILFGSLLAIYLRTLAPGLSWANGGTDGGDLIAAAATGGIAHPTGYPLYLLLARLFQFLPVGSLAYRTNLLSAVFTALAAVLVYEAVSHSIASEQKFDKILPALAGGCAFGLAPLVWSQAVITEVYGLQAFLVALIIYLYCIPPSVFPSPLESPGLFTRTLPRAGAQQPCHCHTLDPYGIAGRIASRYRDSVPGSRFDWRSLYRQILGLALGLSPYLILPLRALAHPMVNWGNPVTFRNFWWLVSGELYQSYYLRSSLAEIWGHAQSGAALLFGQFGVVGILLGMLGLIVFGSRSRLYALTLWITVISAAFAFSYRAEDSYLYLIPVFLCFAIWVGFGIDGLTHGLVARSFPLGLALGLLALGYFLVRSIWIIGAVDASQDLKAESFGREILSTAPENAILFADGDRAIFALWYFHFALRERVDLTIVAVDLLHFDWYQQNLQDVYPSLILPGSFPWPESIAIANRSRTTCRVDFTDAPEMECSRASINQ